jgi:hypothetical protein
MSNINTILDNWKLIIALDPLIRAWTQATYSKDHTIYIGIDERDRPPDADYPCILLYPARKSSGYQKEVVEHIIGVSMGVINAQREPYLKELPGLAEGTNAHTLKIAADCTYSINGIDYTKDAADNIAMTACVEQAINTYCYYLVSINKTGSVTVTKGTSAATSADAAIALPALPADSAPLGTILILTDATHTFTSGTTDLSAAGITATIRDWNIKEYKGVKEAENFRQKVLAAIKSMTEAQRGGMIDSDDPEYAMIEFYPHFVIDMPLTITQSLYQGVDPVE